MPPILKKIFILLLLISILPVLCINFYENYKMHPSFSTSGLNSSEVQEAFKASGMVVNHRDYGFDIVDENNILVHIQSSDKPQIGDQIEVLGVLEPSGYFKGIKVVKISEWGDESLLLRSLFGLILIMIIFFRYWKFNFKIFEFVRRRKE